MAFGLLLCKVAPSVNFDKCILFTHSCLKYVLDLSSTGKDYNEENRGKGVSSLTTCPTCVRRLARLRRHVREQLVPWFWEPYTACWTCKKQFNTAAKLERHLTDTVGHMEFNGEGREDIKACISMVGGILRLIAKHMGLRDLYALYMYIHLNPHLQPLTLLMSLKQISV